MDPYFILLSGCFIGSFIGTTIQVILIFKFLDIIMDLFIDDD